MEAYLENMKSLRSYMNDLEEDAAKRSAEEQQQRTAIEAHDADIALVKAQARQAGEQVELLAKARAQVCVEVSEKQGRIASLEAECATLKQTLELLNQEISSASAKFNEKKLFYAKTTGNMTVQLQEQQEWLGSFKGGMLKAELYVSAFQSKQNFVEGEWLGINSERSLDKLEHDVENKEGELKIQLESAQLKIEDTKSKRLALLLEINKSKQILEQEKNIITCFPAALQQMDGKSLEEEYKALQGDKAGELEYFQSLEDTINGIKVVSDPVTCRCGLEYRVQIGGEAMEIS